MTDVRDEPGAFHVDEPTHRPVGPGPADSTFDPAVLDFGHYAGRSIEELSSIDPDYLRWLERHPSGVRYRAEIRRVLGVTPSSIDWSR
ncbi:MAG TPA: hypothetical protein VHK28_10110 [Candidatus Limnocylindria bacterium]|nr:hypothetical protein [Candidatus Limnocylindria bacterium]